MVLYVGGDLSRKRIDWQAVWPDGSECSAGAARIRTQMSAAHTTADLDFAVERFAAARDALG